MAGHSLAPFEFLSHKKVILGCLSLYNIYKCSNILLGKDPHYSMLASGESIPMTHLPATMNNHTSSQQVAQHNPYEATNTTSYPTAYNAIQMQKMPKSQSHPFHQIQHSSTLHRSVSYGAHLRYVSQPMGAQSSAIRQPYNAQPTQNSQLTNESQDDSSTTQNNDRRHSFSSQFDTKIGYKSQLENTRHSSGQNELSNQRPRSKSNERHSAKREKTVSFKRPMLSE